MNWNEYDGPLFSIRMGGGFLYDYAAYAQDENSEEQIDPSPDGKLRDFRVLFRGASSSSGRRLERGNHVRRRQRRMGVRQTGIMVAVPEV